jgi:hypothetical protein
VVIGGPGLFALVTEGLRAKPLLTLSGALHYSSMTTTSARVSAEQLEAKLAWAMPADVSERACADLGDRCERPLEWNEEEIEFLMSQ